jgi:hypothetical protein
MGRTRRGHHTPRAGTGRELADRWGVDVKHALFHRGGTFYMHLREFPGALFDPNGYVVFKTEEEFLSSPYLRLYETRLNVSSGISSIPGYVRKTT